MTTEEFSNEFDVLINSHANINTFGMTETPVEFDEYEKSVLLTEAQETVVRGIYNGSLNGDSLEKTEEMRRSIDSLITTYTPSIELLPQVGHPDRLGTKSHLYKLPEDLWFIIYESATLNEGSYCPKDTAIEVIPMKHDEWHRSKKNPFKKPNKRKAVRLDAGNKVVEIISEYPIKEYTVRYVRKPNPIILTSLEPPLKINGKSEISDCELNSALHRVILETAIQLANRRLPSASK